MLPRGGGGFYNEDTGVFNEETGGFTKRRTPRRIFAVPCSASTAKRGRRRSCPRLRCARYSSSVPPAPPRPHSRRRPSRNVPGGRSPCRQHVPPLQSARESLRSHRPPEKPPTRASGRRLPYR